MWVGLWSSTSSNTSSDRTFKNTQKECKIDTRLRSSSIRYSSLICLLNLKLQPVSLEQPLSRDRLAIPSFFELNLAIWLTAAGCSFIFNRQIFVLIPSSKSSQESKKIWRKMHLSQVQQCGLVNLQRSSTVFRPLHSIRPMKLRKDGERLQLGVRRSACGEKTNKEFLIILKKWVMNC